MVEVKGRHPVAPVPARTVKKTAHFQDWARTLDAERRAKLTGAIDRVVAGGPNLGRPHVDKIHSTRVARLKEIRVDRGIRVLFAFDTNQNAIMLVGGDKTGKWKHWYPERIKQAERLYFDHERNIGKGSRCLSPGAVRRTPPGISR